MCEVRGWVRRESPDTFLHFVSSPVDLPFPQKGRKYLHLSIAVACYSTWNPRPEMIAIKCTICPSVLCSTSINFSLNTINCIMCLCIGTFPPNKTSFELVEVCRELEIMSERIQRFVSLCVSKFPFNIDKRSVYGYLAINLRRKPERNKMRLDQRSIVVIWRWGMQCCNSWTVKKLEFAPGLNLVL